MNTIFLALGGNVGNVSITFQQAEEQVEKLIGKITMRSSVYKTEPWGNKAQSDFLNKVIIAETLLQSNEAIQCILLIEKKLGRQREKDDQYAPRTIDIDILFFNDEVIETSQLIVPHPRLHLRNFVLAPLSEVAPNLIHPVLHKSIAAIFANTPDASLIEKQF